VKLLKQVRLGELFRTVREHAVVKASLVPALMEEVFDSRGVHVGHVSDVFGPVGSVYVVVRLSPGAKSIPVGEPLFVKARDEDQPGSRDASGQRRSF
jgi:rRNA processing protein Gar1